MVPGHGMLPWAKRGLQGDTGLAGMTFGQLHQRRTGLRHAAANFGLAVHFRGRSELAAQAVQFPDRDRDEWVRLEIESNPLPICTRPQALRSARRT